MAIKLRKSFVPLYFSSKFFCTHPFQRNPLRVSYFGSFLAICGGIGYSVFHLTTANSDPAQENYENDSKKLVAMIIDTYNHYSGYCCFVVLITTPILMQKKMVKALKHMEDIDDLFNKQLGVSIDNYEWSR